MDELREVFGSHGSVSPTIEHIVVQNTISSAVLKRRRRYAATAGAR